MVNEGNYAVIYFGNVKGVALLLNGIPRLKHVVYDVMSDVLTYVDFNTSETILPVFGLKESNTNFF